jgi:hypothetical protein
MHGEFRSALIAAVCKGDENVLKLLLEAGAEVNMRVLHGKYGNCLIAAIATESTKIMRSEIIKTLLDHRADVNMQLMTGAYRSAIEAAWDTGRGDIIQIMLDDGVNEPLLLGDSALGVAEIQSTILCDWELQRLFSWGKIGPDIFDVPTLTKKDNGVLLTTCTEYLEASYGALGTKLLKTVKEALENPIGIYGECPFPRVPVLH